MIAFRDFESKVLKPGSLLKSPKRQTLRQVVIEANEWIQEHSARVLNVETVSLPGAAPSNAPMHNFIREFGYPWRQVVRVWYEGAD